MGKKVVRRNTARREPFPWVLLLLFLGSIYFIWVLPRQLGPRPVQVDFRSADK